MPTVKTMTKPQMKLLRMIVDEPGDHRDQLALRLGGSYMRTVDTLISMGLVVEESRPDNRPRYLWPTPIGAAVARSPNNGQHD